MKKLLKKPLVISAIIIIAIGIIAYLFLSKDDSPTYEFVIAEKRDIIQEVNVTGRVKPAQSVELAFEKSGKVAGAYVDIGDKVSAGQTLAILENSEILAQIAQAEASIESAEAKLAELKIGTRSEEIQVQEVKVANAKVSLEDANRNLIDKLQDAYTKSDDAIRNKVDQLFNNPRTSNPQLSYLIGAIDSQLESTVEWERFLLETVFKTWNTSLSQLTTQSDLSSYLGESKTNLERTKSFLDKIALVVNNLTSNSSLSQTTIDGWKSDISTARTNTNTAITNLTAAEEKLKTAESNLALAEQELTLKKAGTTQEQISAQEAQIKETEANAQYYRAQLAKTTLRAPISGVVTKQDAKVGEIISANSIVVSLISEAKFEIEANVPEADIAKINIGNPATVTLDAYGRDTTFETQVVTINPAETIIEGVSTYKTTFQFITEDDRIKSGMTAKITVSTDKRENVIAIPQRSVIRKNGDKFVEILKGENIMEVPIETGLRGSDGNIEITSGINESDKVITFRGK